MIEEEYVAVSYTHLDVYKRQDPEYQLFMAALKNAGSAPKDQAMLKLHFSQKTAD